MAVQEIEISRFEEEESIIATGIAFDVESAKEPESPTRKRTTATRASAESEDSYQKNLDATQLYLNEIGFSPLLSAEEEVFLLAKPSKAAKLPASV